VGWAVAAAGLAGLALGLALLSRALAAAGRPLRGWPRGLPAPLAALAGAAAAVALQSSSLCVAALVAAADSGALGLGDAWAAIAGANVGTTALPQLLAWELPWPLAAAAGVAGLVCLRTGRLRRLGLGLLGAGVLLLGFRCLQAAVAAGGLAAAERALQLGRGGVLAPFLAGLTLTAVLFSSHFTIGLAQGLVGSAAWPLSAGIRFVCGANVGTTADVLVASLGTGARGRAAATFHLAFNAVLAAWGLVVAEPAAAHLAALPPARALAHAHTFLNLATAVAVLPWVRPLAAAVERRLAGRPPRDCHHRHDRA
jgi:phosphate:Na+ symporter